MGGVILRPGDKLVIRTTGPLSDAECAELRAEAAGHLPGVEVSWLTVTEEPVVVLVQSYCDRSGIRNVWGPFTDEPDARAFEAGLRRAGIDGDLWEVFPLESFPEYRNLLGGQVGPKPPPADKSWLKSGRPA